MPDKEQSPRDIMRRMDLVMVETEDKGTREEDGKEYSVFGVAMKPNPDRYERIEEDDRDGWYDTLDEIFIPKKVLKEGWEQIEGMPIYFSPPEIDDFDHYLGERRSKIRERFQNKDFYIQFENQAQSVLKALRGDDDPYFVIMVVDIEGSTNMNARLPPQTAAALINTFIQEIRVLVQNHTGFVLKYTGDGLIAFFPEPNMVGKHDNSILCASRIQRLVDETINPIYTEYNLPNLNWRVGMDTGRASVFPGAQGTQDLIGLTISLAAKIEGAADSNEIILGEYTELNLHTNWRKRTTDVTTEREWEYERDGSEYRIYRFDPDSDVE